MSDAKPAKKPRRKGLSQKTRFEVFKRDHFTCQYCGAHPPGVLLHVDHFLAVANGGTNDIDNLITACEPCNQGKGARDIKVCPQSLADKAKDVAEREYQLLGYQSILEARRQRLDDETWRVLGALYPGCSDISHDWFSSTRRFIERLGLHAVLGAVDATWRSDVRSKNAFRYFCGVCWNLIRASEAPTPPAIGGRD